MSSHKMLLEEYRAEAYSKDQYVRKLKQLEKEHKQTKASLTGPQSPLMKRHRSPLAKRCRVEVLSVTHQI